MSEIMKIILSLSVSGSIIYVIVKISKFLFKEKISKTWQYYLWLIVIARLILPWSPDINFIGDLFTQADNNIPKLEYINSSEEDILDMSIYSEKNIYKSDLAVEGGNEVKYYPTVEYSLGIILKNFWIIWILVASILLIRKITIYQSFVKYINISKEEINSVKRWEHLGKIVAAKGINSSVSIYINKFISSPLLIGFFKPCIMLPDENLSDSDFEYTILHELNHYKRRDMFYKWLVQITICIHWFNPIVYLMGKEINRDCELACDESVIRKFNEKEKYDYGKILIEASRGNRRYESSLASVTFTESYELLKERLDSIMKSNKKNAYSILISLIVTMVLGCSFTFSGAYAAENVNINQNKKLDIESVGKINGKTTYYIYTENGLRSINLEKTTKDKIYMLANDIVLSSEEWVPIGSKNNPFEGTFNGNGFYIKGLTIRRDSSVVGLFGYAKDAKLHNIELIDIDIANLDKNLKDKKIDPICGVPINVTSIDNKVNQKVKRNLDEKSKMDTFILSGKTYYQVENETQLRLIGRNEYSLDKNYIQVSDINMSTDEWKPIGTTENPFTGTYCGNGFEIKGLTITSPSTSVIGMFGVAEGAAIYNITLRDYDISSAGKNSKTKSVSPILVFGTDSKCYDNHTYPRS